MCKFDIILLCILKDSVKILLVFYYLREVHNMKPYLFVEILSDYYLKLLKVMIFCTFIAVYIVNPLNNSVTRAAIICAIWTSKDWLAGWLCTYGLKKYTPVQLFQVTNLTYIMKKLPVILLITCLVNFIWAWLFVDTEPDDFYTYKLDYKTNKFYKRKFVTIFTLNHWNIKDLLKSLVIVLVLYLNLNKGNSINKVGVDFFITIDKVIDKVGEDFCKIYVITFLLNAPLVLVFKLLSKKVDRIMRTIIIFVLCNIKDYQAAWWMLHYINGYKIAEVDPFYFTYLTKKFPRLILILCLFNLFWAWLLSNVEVEDYFYLKEGYLDF